MGSLRDLAIEGAGYANRALGPCASCPTTPSAASPLRAVWPGCAAGPPAEADCSLCGLRMSENHIVNCKQMQLYRVRRHDAVVLWLFNHLATRRRTTVIYEQKVWVDTEARNQKPDLFLPDLNRAIDVGIVRPEAMGSYYAQKVKAYSTRTVPVIVGTDGTLHPSSATHRRTWASTFPNSWPSPSLAWSTSIIRPLWRI